MLPLGSIIQGYSTHFLCYSDGTQVYLSSKPDDTNLQKCALNGRNVLQTYRLDDL